METFLYYFTGFTLFFILFALIIFIISAFYNGIKQAKNESKGKSEQVVINIVLTDKESKS